MKILEEWPYRSKPFVNMTDDMIRVTLLMTRNEWRKSKSILKAETKETYRLIFYADIYEPESSAFADPDCMTRWIAERTWWQSSGEETDYDIYKYLREDEEKAIEQKVEFKRTLRRIGDRRKQKEKLAEKYKNAYSETYLAAIKEMTNES